MASALGSGGADGAVPGGRRKKAYEWLKAANEVGQAYASRWSGQRGVSQEDYYNTPGAFPNVAIARSGDEEMVLFPSYARKLATKKKSSSHTSSPSRRDSWSRTIDEYRGVPDEKVVTKGSWDESTVENAVVEVDVRGWIHAPSRGPLSRKHRIMIRLARSLSGIPAPSGSTNDDTSEQPPNSRGEDELLDKEMRNLVDTAEKDADTAWKSAASNRRGSSTSTNTGVGPTISQAAVMTKDEISMANAHLMERLRPFLTNPMAGMPVTIFFFNENESESRNVMTDEAGYFTIRAPMPFVPTHIRVLASEDLSAAKPIDVIEPAGISLISDIDDTVKHSAISSGAKEIFRNTFVRELAELNIDGVSEWYSQVAQRGVKIHYVSNAPWQLYPLLERYFKQVGLPPGSFHLKQYSGMLQGIFEPTAERKRGPLEQILRDFPERKFILVGDSGEADLEVYTEVVLANPGRILGIFIRDVTTVEKKAFFDKSVGDLESTAQDRSSPSLVDASDLTVKRPTLPPRRPMTAPLNAGRDSLPSEDLIDLEDDGFTGSKPAPMIPHATKPRQPPGKPAKPSSLRTVQGSSDQVAAGVSSGQTSFQETIRRKPNPPLPFRRAQAKSDSLIDLETSRSTSRSSSAQPSNKDSSAYRSGRPPPVPPPRRSNTASPSTGSANSGTNTPRSSAPAAKQSYPAAAGAAAQAALNYATERLNLTASSVTTLRTSASSQSLARASTTTAADPLPNKRQELWRRRWERASEVLGERGVVLGSWRVGTDAQSVCLWLIEEEQRKLQGHEGSTGAGRRS